MTCSSASWECRLGSRSQSRSASSMWSHWLRHAVQGGLSHLACLCGLRASCRDDISISNGEFDVATEATAAAMTGLFVILHNRRFSSCNPLGPLDLLWLSVLGLILAGPRSVPPLFVFPPCCAAPPVGGEL